MSQSQTLKRPLSTATATTNKSWNITNNSDTDILVIDAYSDDDLSTEQMYERLLQIAATTNGQQFIKAGETETVSLDVTRTVHTIIMARADNLFPVKTIEVTLDSNTQTFPPVTVTPGDVANMKLAAKFRQMITAFPSSDLAADFSIALSDPDTTKVDAFFQSNEEYKSLTLNMVLAVETYYTVFPFVWADYKTSKTYYLYTSDGTENIYLGSVLLNNQCTVPISTNKEVPGFNITYTSNEEEDKPLYYVNGKFVDDKDSDSPAISLSGLFILKSQLTFNDADNTIVSTLTGNVNDDKVFGYEEEQKKDSHGNWLGLYGLFHPEDTKDWLELCGIALGILVGIAILCKSVKVAMDAIRKLRNNPSPNDKDALDKRVMSEEEIRIEQQTQNARFMAQAKTVVTTLLIKDNRSYMYDLLDKQRAYIEKMTKYGVDDGMQEVIDSFDGIEKEIAKIEGAAPNDLGQLMDGIIKRINTNSTLLNQKAQEIKNEASAQEKAALEKSSEAIEKASARLEESERKRLEWEEDEVPGEVEVIDVLE